MKLCQEILRKAALIILCLFLGLPLTRGADTTYTKKGIRWALNGTYDKALFYFQKALDEAVKDRDSDRIKVAHNNIAYLYGRMSDHANAIKHYKESLNCAKRTNDRTGIAATYKNLGEEYVKLRETDTALYYLQMAKDMLKDNGPLMLYAHTLRQMGEAYLLLHDTPRAEAFFEEAYPLYQSIEPAGESGRTEGVSVTALRLASIALAKKDLQKARMLLNESEKAAAALGDIYLYQDIYKTESDYFARQGRMYEALAYLKKYTILRDSLFSLDNSRKIAAVEFSNKMESKEKENTILRQKTRLREAEIRSSHAQRNLFLVLLGMMCLGGMIGISQYRSRARLHQSIRVKNDELTQLNFQLKDANESKDRLFTLFSHDLKIPSASLYKFSDALAENVGKLNDAELKQVAGMIKSLSGQVNSLLDDLLESAKLLTNRIPYQPVTINVQELLTEGIDFFNLRSSEKNILIVEKYENGLQILADKSMIQSVIRNLLSNALKYTKRGGTIIAHTYAKENNVYISICDNGIGMSPEVISQLFRLDKLYSTPGTENEEGNGIGMALVYEMVKRNQGMIDITSEECKGTTITLSFPNAKHTA